MSSIVGGSRNNLGTFRVMHFSGILGASLHMSLVSANMYINFNFSERRRMVVLNSVKRK